MGSSQHIIFSYFSSSVSSIDIHFIEIQALPLSQYYEIFQLFS